jgi:hypothetical protein
LANSYLCRWRGFIYCLFILVSILQDACFRSFVYAFFFTVLFGTFRHLLYDSNLIQIDTTKQTITFKNQLTRKRSSFQFSDFDGKLLCFEPIKGGYVRNLYLVINKRAVRKFTDFIYSNQSEIESALSSIKDLGTFNYSYLKTWRISLGLPILK